MSKEVKKNVLMDMLAGAKKKADGPAEPVGEKEAVCGVCGAECAKCADEDASDEDVAEDEADDES